MLYLWLDPSGQPQVKLVKQAYADMETCKADGQARVQSLVKDPRFVQGLYAGCMPLEGQEAKS